MPGFSENALKNDVDSDVKSDDTRASRSIVKWSEEEHSRLIEAVREHGRDWKQVTAAVATRSNSKV